MTDLFDLQDLKNHLPEYVNQITEPDRKAGKSMYICPLCGSGSSGRRDSDGAFSVYENGTKWKCFSCGKGGDIFDLVGEVENVSDKGEQFRRVQEIVSGAAYIEPAKRPERKEKQMDKKPVAGQFKVEIDKWHEDAGKTDYFEKRGFDAEAVERFHLGYDTIRSAIVIPYDQSASYYIKRSTKGKDFYKPGSDKAGSEPVFNKGALYSGKPVFVYESQLDALSTLIAANKQAGAIALGGGGLNKLKEQISEKKPEGTLILDFDGDEHGEDFTQKAKRLLEDLRVPFIVATHDRESYQGKHKDANDLLTADKEKFAAEIAADAKKAAAVDQEAWIKELDAREKAERMKEIMKHSAKNILIDFVKDIREGKGTPCIKTGFPSLDQNLDGGLYPGLYIMGAMSSLGKTTLMLQIADQMAESGTDVLYFSLEMSERELIAKSISRYTYILCDEDKQNRDPVTMRDVLNYDKYFYLSKSRKNLVNKAVKAYEEFAGNLFLFEGVGDIGVEQIKASVANHIELTGRTPVVFIDYLQILAPNNIRATDKQNTDKAVVELKRMSRDYNTPVFAISSFNRDNYSKEVSMSSFKESGAIEYGSDVLIGLQPAGMKGASEKNSEKDNIDTMKKCKSSIKREEQAVILKSRNGRANVSTFFVYHALYNHFTDNNGFRPAKDVIPEIL